MGDVAQILGDTQAKAPALPPNNHNPSTAMKITGMSKEVMNIMSGNQDIKSAALPPIFPAFDKDTPTETESKDVKVKVGSKWISSIKPARQWTWAPFASSSRTDGAMFRHWVRANVDYPDYPYAKFDIHLDPVTYSEEEYGTYLKSDVWTKSETDKLMELGRRYELRWPVIHDRWFGYYHAQDDNSVATRQMEDLQQRYYSVAAILSQIRISQEAAAEASALSAALPDPAAEDVKEKMESLLLETAAAKALASSNPNNQPLINNVGTGSTNKLFDATFERDRRAHVDRLWKRSKEEEREEMELRKELKMIEAQLRRLKKTGGHIFATSKSAAPAPNRLSGGASSRNPSRSVSPVPGAKIPGVNFIDNPDILDQSFASTAPTPMPQNPYLQSGRLVPPATGGGAGINKTVLAKLDQILAELKLPVRPMPTKRVCDLYDSVRKDALTLLTLQKMLMQREGNIQAKRVKLSKMGIGEGRVLDEETLLGIVPPPPPAPSAPSTATKSSKSRPKGKATGGGSKKSSTPKAKGDDASKPSGSSGAKKTKTATKRKRKSEAKNPTSAPASSVSTVPSSQGGPGQAKVVPAAKSPAKAASSTKVTANTDSKQQGGKKRARKT